MCFSDAHFSTWENNLDYDSNKRVELGQLSSATLTLVLHGRILTLLYLASA